MQAVGVQPGRLRLVLRARQLLLRRVQLRVHLLERLHELLHRLLALLLRRQGHPQLAVNPLHVAVAPVPRRRGEGASVGLQPLDGVLQRRDLELGFLERYLGELQLLRLRRQRVEHPFLGFPRHGEIGLERLNRGAVIGRSQRLPVGHLQDAVRAVSLVAHLAQLAPKLGDLMIHVPPAFLHLVLDGLSGS